MLKVLNRIESIEINGTEISGSHSTIYGIVQFKFYLIAKSMNIVGFIFWKLLSFIKMSLACNFVDNFAQLVTIFRGFFVAIWIC